jgi:hypothetical protein
MLIATALQNEDFSLSEDQLVKHLGHKVMVHKETPREY